MNTFIKYITLIFIIAFICLYLTTTTGYYEKRLSEQNILTEEAILRFEQDVKEGKHIIASNYIKEPISYNNKLSSLMLKTSDFISKTFDKIIKYIFKNIEKTVNN
jgi:hypothetical protein